MKTLNERNLQLSHPEIMKCKNDSSHSPVRWDGLWDKMYSDEGMQIVQWTCKQCGGTFSKEVPELDAFELHNTLTK